MGHRHDDPFAQFAAAVAALPLTGARRTGAGRNDTMATLDGLIIEARALLQPRPDQTSTHAWQKDHVYAAVSATPKTLRTIARRAGFCGAVTRTHLTTLINAGLVRYTPDQGFYRAHHD